MNGAIYLLIISVLSMVLQFIMMKPEKITDERNKWFRIFKRRGLIALFISLSIIIVSYFQYRHFERVNEKTAANIKQEQNIRDSIIKDKVDSTSSSLYSKLSIALKKNDLKLDTANMTLEKLRRDSAKKVINNYAADDPVIFFSDTAFSLLRMEGSSYKFGFTIVSKDASSNNHHIQMHTVGKSMDGKLFYMGASDLPGYNVNIPKNNGMTFFLTLSPPVPISEIFVYLKGDFTNSSGTTKYSIEPTLYRYYFNSNKMGLQAIPRPDVMEVLKKYL